MTTKLYSTQTALARDNFNLDYKLTSMSLIHAIVFVKKAAAMTYDSLGVGKDGVYKAIVEACDYVLAGNADDMFVVDALQGGAGTSTNMNVNEVIANVALRILGQSLNDFDYVHPLDDVNRGQSTNDVYPTALRIASINLLRKLSNECASLQTALQRRENEFDDVKKIGRTELMDAVPVTLGMEFGAYSQAIARDRWRLYKVEERLRQVNIGATAVGLADNADRKYRYAVIETLRDLTGIGLAAAEYPMDITQNYDVFVEVSGLIKALAVNLMKISNDLRLMNSGPHGGLSEIMLQSQQMGSTIMPGKVNPVIPEMIMQVAIRVMSNDFAITTAAAHGEFELNAFAPLIADALLESLTLLTNAVPIFRTKCIETLTANKIHCQTQLENSLTFTTAYVPKLGYDKVVQVINENNGDAKNIKEALEKCVANE